MEKPTIFGLYVSNFFPSVKKELAIPAIKQILHKQNLNNAEINAVIEAIYLVRGGSFFNWKDSFWQQISGCARGDPDSCSYTDITMADYLSKIIPETQQATKTCLDHFKIYRDDGIGVIFSNP